MLYSTSRTSVKPSLFVYSVAGDIKLLAMYMVFDCGFK